MKDKLLRIIKFIREDIWQIRIKEKQGREKAFLRFLRTFYLAIRGFRDDQCMFRASSLTFFTLLSIVPIFAMAFGIAKGFGFEKLLEEQLYTNFAGQEEAIARIVDFSRSMLDNTKGGMIAGIGILTLLYSVVKVLHHIEMSFNIIWEITEQRSWYRKISDYVTIMISSPILIILSSSFNIFVAGFLSSMTAKFELLGVLSPIIEFSVRFLPFLIIWVLLFFLYVLLPNTKVKFSSAALGAIIAGSMFQLLQWVYLTFQIGISKYNAIYGSFAALPLLLIWMQNSWFVVLFGAEISFSLQNEHFYEYEKQTRSLSLAIRRKIAVLLMHAICKSYEKEENPLSAMDLAENQSIPIRATKIVLFELINSGIIIRIESENGENRFIPAFDINKITISKIIEKLDTAGNNFIDLSANKNLGKVDELLRDFTTNEGNYNLPITTIF